MFAKKVPSSANSALVTIFDQYFLFANVELTYNSVFLVLIAKLFVQDNKNSNYHNLFHQDQNILSTFFAK